MTRLPRATGAERMDEPDQDPAELARSLADLRAVNRWLGGTRVVVHHFARLLEARPPGPVRVLDVATGSADVPLRLARWARARGIDLSVTATDLHPATLAEARRRTRGEPAVEVLGADARRLPFADGAFDVALCSTALHHFDDEAELLCVLGELRRVARVGGIVNDLRRSLPALLGARLLAATAWRRHPVTRHDGPLSVRRAFTPAELAGLAARAGLPKARVHAHVPFRVALVWEEAP